MVVNSAAVNTGMRIFFFFLIFKLFIFVFGWIFVAARGLALLAASGSYAFVATLRVLSVVTSLVEHWL